MTHITRIDKTKFGPWALVTGASSGIGEEFARQLAASGLNLVLVARRLPLLETLGRQLSDQYGIEYRAVGADLSESGFLDKIEAVACDLDIGMVVSNAGSGHPGAFLSHDPALLHRVVRLNVDAHLTLVHHYGQRLAKRGRGGVLMVSAMGASGGLPYMSNDAATKAYSISLAQGLNVEFRKLGLHMTVLLPGPTDTAVIDEFGLDRAAMPMKPMTVAQCVAEGLTAFNANRATHLSGRLNRLMIALVPASIIRRVLGNMIAKGAAKRQSAASTQTQAVTSSR